MHPCARGHAIHGTANQLLNMYMYMKQLMRQKLHVQTQLTEQKKRGLNTHPCRTPALMQNSRLTSECPVICPVWFEYTTCNNQTR